MFLQATGLLPWVILGFIALNAGGHFVDAGLAVRRMVQQFLNRRAAGE